MPSIDTTVRAGSREDLSRPADLDPDETLFPELQSKETWNAGRWNSPEFDRLVELAQKTRVYQINITDRDGTSEALLIGDTARPSAWGPRNFIAVARRDAAAWGIAAFKEIDGSIGCATEDDCGFQYSKVVLDPQTPNEGIVAFVAYARYGASGHTFLIEIVGRNRSEDNYRIETIISPVPLVPDVAWSD
jgi:hypothetical protein